MRKERNGRRRASQRRDLPSVPQRASDEQGETTACARKTRAIMPRPSNLAGARAAQARDRELLPHPHPHREEKASSSSSLSGSAASSASPPDLPSPTALLFNLRQLSRSFTSLNRRALRCLLLLRTRTSFLRFSSSHACAHTMHTHRTHTLSISCALQSASATVRTSRQRQQRWWRPLTFDICEVARRAPRQPSPHCTLPHASAESLRHYAHWCGGQAEPRTFKRISFLACRFLEKKAILIDRMRATRYSSEC